MPAFKNPFAFGQNRTTTCSCPAIEAGIHPENDRKVAMVAMEYDDAMAESQSDAYGIASEEDAKEGWKQAIVTLEDKAEPTAARRGREVARELGWSLDV